MLNPIEKFKRSILHLNRSLHHCCGFHQLFSGGDEGHHIMTLYCGEGWHYVMTSCHSISITTHHNITATSWRILCGFHQLLSSGDGWHYVVTSYCDEGWHYVMTSCHSISITTHHNIATTSWRILCGFHQLFSSGDEWHYIVISRSWRNIIQ